MTSRRELRDRLARHLRVLVEDIGARPPGSPANRRATDHVRGVLERAGLEVREASFTTRYWEPGRGTLHHAGGSAAVAPDPYSPTCDVTGTPVVVDHLADLERLSDAAGRVVVLRGELVREQVMPAAFPFVQPEEHRRIRAALQAAGPAAVVAATDHWQPVFEEPDLGFPSVTVPAVLGARVAASDRVRLVLAGRVHDGEGVTVSGRTSAAARTVLSAHVDTKATTPGALDNGGGVAVLLAAVEGGLLDGVGPVEVVFFNGEDHFDACGEVAWLDETDLDEVICDVNLDGVGLSGHGTSVAGLACPAAAERALADFVVRCGWELVDPWVESDHAVFAFRGIPAVALTSSDVRALLGALVHGPADTLEIVDVEVLVDVARRLPTLLADLVAALRVTAS